MNPAPIYSIAPASMPELLFTAGFFGGMVTLCLVAIAHFGPELLAEARDLFKPEPAEVVDIADARRRRQLMSLVVGGSRRAG